MLFRSDASSGHTDTERARPATSEAATASPDGQTVADRSPESRPSGRPAPHRERADRDRRDDRPARRDDRRAGPGRDSRGGPDRGDRGDRGARRDRGDRRDGGDRPRRIPESAERTFVAEPDLPDSVSSAELDPSVRRDLRGLQKETAESVARHLVAAGILVDEDPTLALEHVRYARRRASRIAVVREAAGIVAYHAGEWNEALGEFRAARRMGGGPGHVHVMADIERALGRPERALDLARSPESRDLGREERIELLIVAAGARRDLGELDAAVVGLQVPELDPAARDPWSPRLFYAYADNLLAAGREADAIQWFVHAHDADTEGQTDAAARIAELTGEELAASDDDELTIGYEELPDDPADSPDPRGAAEPSPDATGPAERPVDGTSVGGAAPTGHPDGGAPATADAEGTAPATADRPDPEPTADGHEDPAPAPDDQRGSTAPDVADRDADDAPTDRGAATADPAGPQVDAERPAAAVRQI